MLSTPEAARDVFYAPKGVLAGMGVRSDNCDSASGKGYH